MVRAFSKIAHSNLRAYLLKLVYNSLKWPNFVRGFVKSGYCEGSSNHMPKVQILEDSIDPTTFGRNVRELRRVRGWSIDMLAKRAGVAPHTVLRIEQGRPSTETRRTRIAYALDTVMERLANIGTLDRNDVAVHTSSDDQWMSLIDRRSVIPEENADLIQTAEERSRLGRLAFVPQFVKVLRCRLPKGKLIAGVLEMYTELPASRYLGGEIFAFALRGDAYLNLGGEQFLLREGSATTFDCTKPFSFSPASMPVAADDPPLVLYVRLEEVDPIETRKPKRGRSLDGQYEVWADLEGAEPSQRSPSNRRAK